MIAALNAADADGMTIFRQGYGHGKDLVALFWIEVVIAQHHQGIVVAAQMGTDCHRFDIIRLYAQILYSCDETLTCGLDIVNIDGCQSFDIADIISFCEKIFCNILLLLLFLLLIFFSSIFLVD